MTRGAYFTYIQFEPVTSWEKSQQLYSSSFKSEKWKPIGWKYHLGFYYKLIPKLLSSTTGNLHMHDNKDSL